ncbi:MAG TPA: M48 family metallopeptidase [Vicinamibacterales bacterium]
MVNEDKATRYHRLRRRASVLGTLTQTLCLLLLLATGASVLLRDAVIANIGHGFMSTVTVYVIVVALILDVCNLPWAFYTGVTLERRYGLSTESTARWWINHVKASAIALVFSIAAAFIVLPLARWSPQRWWIIAASVFTLILVVLAQLAPVVLLPIFYEVTPLTRESLRDRLLSLAERAGAQVLGVFEWRLSERTRKANAALAGIGRTRRILVSDTLLADHTDDEIEVILAHELAHHVHHDIWTAIAVEAVLVGLGFYLADAALIRFGVALDLNGKGDVAGLPLLVLAGGAASLALLPIVNGLSRAHERRADRYALDLTRNPSAFIAAMKRLATQNLAEDRPSLLVRVLFSTHPSTSARIEAAKQWSLRNARSIRGEAV